MANKEQKIIPNNLLEIRTRLGYTQKEMGKKLDVSERMIYNYETDASNLPIDKAVYISNEWNYDLSWIYKQPRKGVSTECYPIEENINFLVDIRKFITIQGDDVLLSIPNSFWDYLKENYKINNSSYTEHEKARALAELNASYKADNNEKLFNQFSLPIYEFAPNWIFNDTSCIYATEDKNDLPPINEIQKDECKAFINNLPN